MNFRIEKIDTKKLIGIKINMTFKEDKTYLLWSSFMPRRKEIKNKVSNDLFSLKMFPLNMFSDDSSLNQEFDKWAAVEVINFENIPQGMEKFVIESGLYAVFEYKGSSSEGEKVFSYIYGTWIPQSEYFLDNYRPHFEIFGKKYNNNDPESEEEIWIPVKLKNI